MSGYADLRNPKVSVILTTRDRPEFLCVALRLYAEQTYPNRELIVVDDGDVAPADPTAVAAVGGKIVRVETGTTIGTKLNHGLDVATGELCQKMDDDDWYAPSYIQTCVQTLTENWKIACRPTVCFVTPFLFFNVAAWEIRRSADGNVPGATLFFRHQDWRDGPFRNLPGDEDLWFYQDQLQLGAVPLAIKESDIFLAVRHRGSRRNRGHTWINQWNNISLEDFLLERPLHKSPEEILSPWALAFYRELRQEILASGEDQVSPGDEEDQRPDAL